MQTLLPKISLGDGAIELPVLFPYLREISLEVGAGGGEHVAAQAKAHPDAGFIACEPFVNGVAKLLAQIDAEGLANIRVHMGDAREVLERLGAGSLASVFVLFPDPWPKARHHKRRFIRPENLDQIARVLRTGGELRLATDHGDYAAWALEHLSADARFQRAGEWRERPADWPATRYEQKALKAGRGCIYFSFVRK
jgi:tRNA (guanine-N7-)-methyltransferase